MLCYQDVRGFQVAVSDISLVRYIKGIQNLPPNSTAFSNDNGPFERPALHILHNQVVASGILKLADVGMIQRRCNARRIEETLDHTNLQPRSEGRHHRGGQHGE